MPQHDSVEPVGMPWHVVSSGAAHRVLPDGVMDFVCSSGRLLFAGPDTQAATVLTPAGTVTWGLRLSPGVAYALLGIPADDLVNQRIGVADLIPLSEAVIDTAHTNPDAALRVLVEVLWHRACPNAHDLALAASLNRAAQLGFSVREIADQHGISERTLHRASNRFFGYGIKQLQSIHRFQNALRLARTGRPLGESAAAAGYADQPHFARETRRLTGTTLLTLLN